MRLPNQADPGRGVGLAGALDERDVAALVEVARRTGNPVEQALTSLVVGRCLQRRASAEGAAHLRAAVDMLGRCGAHALALLATRWLDEEDRPAPFATWTAGLTARELQVARSVAEGDTNRLVARRLGLSERTVEVHLTSIFRKLGVASRTELALVVVTGGRRDE